MHFLVTGGTGFIGRHVCRSLIAAGHQVTAVSRTPTAPAAGIEMLAADLLQPGVAAQLFAGRSFDRVIHLAWTVEHGRFWSDPANLDWLAATMYLARAVADAKVPHLTVTGTCFEYDWPADADCEPGLTPTTTHTLYDAAKDACHRALAAHAAQTGYGLAWARIFHLYGPDEHPNRLVSSVARALVAGEPARTSRGLPLRDFMDVRDAGHSIARVSEAAYAGPVNIASGEPVTVAQVVRTLGDLAGRPDLIRIGALPDRDEPPRITADVTGLRAICGLPAHRLEHGLSDAIDAWRESRPAG